VSRYATELQLEVRTGAPDGLISWLGLDLAQEDYLGLGIDDGLVKVQSMYLKFTALLRFQI
jgi:hypothetical protein